MNPPKIPHNRCMTVRLTQQRFMRLKDEAQEGHKSLSQMLNNKMRTAFQVLFKALNEEGEDK